MLSAEKVEKWHEDGFITLSSFFDEERRAALSRCVNEISDWGISDEKWMMWFEKTSDDRKILSKVENFIDYHDEINQILLGDGRIISVIESLLNEEARRLKELLIFKYPDSGGFRPHQDIYHIPHGLPERIVHAVVAIGIDDSDPDNGGLYFSAGNHKKGVFPLDEGGVMDPEVATQFDWKPISLSSIVSIYAAPQSTSRIPPLFRS